MNHIPLISEDDHSEAVNDPRGYRDKDVRQGKLGFTMFNNALIDVLQPMLTPEEWGALCFLLRKTVGWHRTTVRLSLETLSKHCIPNHKTLAAARRAVRGLEARQLIHVKRPSGKTARRREMSAYTVGTALNALLTGDILLFYQSSPTKY